MKKKLQIIILAASLLFPLAMQSQTDCDSLTLPYTEDFDSYTGSTQSDFPNVSQPDCWSFINQNITQYPNIDFPYAYIADSSAYLTYIGNSLSILVSLHNPPLYAIMPEFNVLDSETYELSFTYATTSTGPFIIGTMSDATDTNTFVPLDTCLHSYSNTLKTLYINGSSLNNSRIAFYIWTPSDIYYRYVSIDNVSLQLISCISVTNLEIDESLTTPSSLTLSWTDNYNMDVSYTIYNMSDTSVVASNITGTTYTVTGLNSNTTYTFAVVSDCGAGDLSTFSENISGTTDCDPETLPWSENFDSWTTKSDCWSFMSGSFGKGNPIEDESAWELTTHYNLAYPKALTMTLEDSNRYWAVTPFINMSSDDILLSFKLAVTGYNQGQVAHHDSNDSLIVAITTDHGVTYTPLLVFDGIQLDSLSSTYTTIRVPILGYNGQTARIVLFAGSFDNHNVGQISRIFIDSITVEEFSGCLEVVMHQVRNISSNSAVLNWTSNSTSFNVYSVTGNNYELIQTVNADTIALTGLTPLTQYTYAVAAVCDTNESLKVCVSFSTVSNAVAIPFTETFESDSPTLDLWTTEGPGTWQYGSNTSTAYAPFEGSRYAYITHSVTGNITKLISPVLDLGTSNHLILSYSHSQYWWVYDIDVLRVYYRVAADSAWRLIKEHPRTNYNWAVETDTIEAPVYQVAFEMEDFYGYGVAIDSVVFNTPPPCDTVTNLRVHYISSNTAQIRWAGNAASYDIYNGNTFVANITTHLYTFTGLNPETEYTFGVRARCSDISISPMATIDTITDCGVISTFPYTQNFNSEPVCWTSYDGDGDGNGWQFVQGTMQSASYDSESGPLAPDNWLISPMFQLDSGTSYEVTWNASSMDAYFTNEHYALYVSTSNADTGSFTRLMDYTLTSDVQSPVVNLNNYAGQTIYLALRHWNCTNMFRIAIDNFEIRQPAGPDQITVTLYQNNLSYGNVSGAGVYYTEKDVIVKAVPNTGCVFFGWLDNNDSTVSTDNIYKFMADSNVTLQAVFTTKEIDTLILITNVNNDIMGSVAGGGAYPSGSTAILTATANNGYTFVNWTQNDVILGNGKTLSIIVTPKIAESPIVANFEEIVGLNDVENIDVIAHGVNGQIVLNGAKGHEVFIFDINGRLLHHTETAAESEHYYVSASGVYLLHIVGFGTKRVVIIR